MQAASRKTCVICGQDCSQRPRIKDPKGRYYCKECHEKAKLRRAGATEPDDGLNLVLGDIASCPSCGLPVAAGAVLCTRCGVNVHTGQRMEVAVVEAPPVAGPVTSGAGLGRSRIKVAKGSHRLVRQEYVKPLVLVCLGGPVAMIVMAGIEGGSAPAGTVVALLYPVVLGIKAVLGAAVVWLAARL